MRIMYNSHILCKMSSYGARNKYLIRYFYPSKVALPRASILASAFIQIVASISVYARHAYGDFLSRLYFDKYKRSMYLVQRRIVRSLKTRGESHDNTRMLNVTLINVILYSILLGVWALCNRFCQIDGCRRLFAAVTHHTLCVLCML